MRVERERGWGSHRKRKRKKELQRKRWEEEGEGEGEESQKVALVLPVIITREGEWVSEVGMEREREGDPAEVSGQVRMGKEGRKKGSGGGLTM